MKLKDLLSKEAKIVGDDSVEITSLTFKSVEVHAGSLYFCIRGENFDGHDFAREVSSLGASAIVVEKLQEVNIPQVLVKDSRKALSEMCAKFYGNPQKKLKFIGITGTNGKTTSTFIIREILKEAGYKVGVVGTQGAFINGRSYKCSLTTPDPTELYALFKKMVDRNVDYVVMEASAHAIFLEKLEGIEFEVGVLTNITQDHLDFFNTMKHYEDTKISFLNSKHIKTAVVNIDDERVRRNLKKIDVPTITYGLNNPADVFALDIEKSLTCSKFVVNAFDNVFNVECPLVGEFNVYNLLDSISTCFSLGINERVIIKALKKVKAPLGRFSVMNITPNITAIIDFAHTPDGMENVLKTIKGVYFEKLVCVFGCGGNRDTGKRSIMGNIAEKYSNFIVLTSDNPRFEDPAKILDDIERGMKKTNHVKIVDRREAIKYALGLVADGGVVAILGKGGELYQDINGVKTPYNDFEEIEKAL